MKAESTIRRTMQRLYKESSGNGSQEQCRMAYGMAIAPQWIIEDTSWNPVSLLATEDKPASFLTEEDDH